MKLSLEDRVVLITGPAKAMAAPITHAFAAEASKLPLRGRAPPPIRLFPDQGKPAPGKTGVQTTPEEFDEIVTLNMNGCFHTMRAALPTMIEQRYGKVVNVGGTFGMRGRAGRVAYSASKWGLRGITKSFALEVGQFNINVHCVAPGMVDGPRFRDKVCRDMAQKLGISEEEAAERHAADYAMKRVTVDADVANACLFFASAVSRQVTGVDLPVDGGWAML